MSFQTIITVERPDFYIDLAFRRANAKAKELKKEKIKKDPLNKQKDIDLEKIKIINATFEKHLTKILLTFPDVDGLTEFYRELVKISLDYVLLKKSFGAVKWVLQKVTEFSKLYAQKVKISKSTGHLATLRTEYYGRISSLIKQIKHELAYLETARKIIKNFPVIKSNIKTIVIIGFPNVGKTTLLYKLTGSKPAIGSYAFTTKSINVAYIEKKVQLVDVPGTLDRFNKMNDIERQAMLAMKYCADRIVYVFDVTEPYPLKKQIALLQSLKKTHKNIILYASKADIAPPEALAALEKKYTSITDAETLKELMLDDLD